MLARTTRFAALFAFTACCAVTGCASTQFKDINVVTDTAAEGAFDTYNTYAWMAAAAIIRDPNTDWIPPDFDVDSEIQFLVNREMRNLGFTEVVDDPDLVLIYAIGIDMMALELVMDENETEQFNEIEEGSLLIALGDVRTGEFIWGGAASAELLEEPNADLSRQRLNYAITEIFKGYPRRSE